MAMKKKSPWPMVNGSDAAPSWTPGDDSFEDNAHQHPWRPGYVQFEDGSWGRPYGNGGGGFNYGPDDDSFEGNARQHPWRPGYVQFEDGSWGPPYGSLSEDEKARRRARVAAILGKPIEW